MTQGELTPLHKWEEHIGPDRELVKFRYVEGRGLYLKWPTMTAWMLDHDPNDLDREFVRLVKKIARLEGENLSLRGRLMTIYGEATSTQHWETVEEQSNLGLDEEAPSDDK